MKRKGVGRGKEATLPAWMLKNFAGTGHSGRELSQSEKQEALRDCCTADSANSGKDSVESIDVTEISQEQVTKRVRSSGFSVEELDRELRKRDDEARRKRGNERREQRDLKRKQAELEEQERLRWPPSFAQYSAEWTFSPAHAMFFHARCQFWYEARSKRYFSCDDQAWYDFIGPPNVPPYRAVEPQAVVERVTDPEHMRTPEASPTVVAPVSSSALGCGTGAVKVQMHLGLGRSSGRVPIRAVSVLCDDVGAEEEGRESVSEAPPHRAMHCHDDGGKDEGEFDGADVGRLQSDPHIFGKRVKIRTSQLTAPAQQRGKDQDQHQHVVADTEPSDEGHEKGDGRDTSHVYERWHNAHSELKEVDWNDECGSEPRQKQQPQAKPAKASRVWSGDHPRNPRFTASARGSHRPAKDGPGASMLVGAQLMQRFGWKEGEGLGVASDGICAAPVAQRSTGAGLGAVTTATSDGGRSNHHSGDTYRDAVYRARDARFRDSGP